VARAAAPPLCSDHPDPHGAARGPCARPFRLRTFGLAALLGALVLSAVVAAPPHSAVAAGPVSISGVILDSDGSTAGGQHIEAYLADGGPG
jgi:hypothetical protein